MIKSKTYSAKLFVLGAALLIAQWSSPAYASMADRIVAVVNDEPVTQSEVDDIVVPLYFELQNEYKGQELNDKLAEVRQSALSQLVEDLLIYQEAQKLGVKISDEEVDEMIQKFRSQFSAGAEMDSALKARGLTLHELRKSYHKQIAVRMLHAYAVRSKIIISPQQIQKYYDEHLSEFTEGGYRLLSCIMIKKNPVDIKKGTTSEEKKKLIQDILGRLRTGEDFSELAKRYSEDPRASQGGEMKAVREGDLLPVFEEAVRKLKPGEASDVIESETSYHIFRLDKQIPAESKTLSEVREKIQNTLYRRELESRYETWIKALKEKAYISIK